jgi:hypothetical protein
VHVWASNIISYTIIRTQEPPKNNNKWTFHHQRTLVSLIFTTEQLTRLESIYSNYKYTGRYGSSFEEFLEIAFIIIVKGVCVCVLTPTTDYLL